MDNVGTKNIKYGQLRSHFGPYPNRLFKILELAIQVQDRNHKWVAAAAQRNDDETLKVLQWADMIAEIENTVEDCDLRHLLLLLLHLPLFYRWQLQSTEDLKSKQIHLVLIIKSSYDSSELTFQSPIVTEDLFLETTDGIRHSFISLRRRRCDMDRNVHVVIQMKILGIISSAKFFFLFSNDVRLKSRKLFYQIILIKYLTFSLSFMTPFPNNTILADVSFIRAFKYAPLGPIMRPVQTHHQTI